MENAKSIPVGLQALNCKAFSLNGFQIEPIEQEISCCGWVLVSSCVGHGRGGLLGLLLGPSRQARSTHPAQGEQFFGVKVSERWSKSKKRISQPSTV